MVCLRSATPTASVSDTKDQFLHETLHGCQDAELSHADLNRRFLRRSQRAHGMVAARGGKEI